jgi:hypothetical protein
MADPTTTNIHNISFRMTSLVEWLSPSQTFNLLTKNYLCWDSRIDYKISVIGFHRLDPCLPYALRFSEIVQEYGSLRNKDKILLCCDNSHDLTDLIAQMHRLHNAEREEIKICAFDFGLFATEFPGLCGSLADLATRKPQLLSLPSSITTSLFLGMNLF